VRNLKPSHLRQTLGLAFFIVMHSNPLFAADSKVPLTDKCPLYLKQVDLSLLKFSKVEPKLVKPVAALQLKSFPHLVPLSGKLVSDSTLAPGVNARGLFTCDKCGTHNQLHMPHPDKAGVVCTQCGDWKTKEDGKYYLFPKDEHGHSMEGLVDIVQLVEDPTERRIRATKWDCETCGREVTEGESFCPTCNFHHDPEAKEVAAALDEVARVAREGNLNRTPEGRALLKGEKAAEGFLGHLGESKEKFQDAFKNAQNYYKTAGRVDKNKIKAIAGALGVSVATATLLYLYFDTEDYPGTIASTSWSRSISFEEERTFSESGWCDSVPSGAFNIVNLGKRQYSKLRGQANESFAQYLLKRFSQEAAILPMAFAQSGWSDNDNGYFTRGSGSGSSSSGGGSGYSGGGSDSQPAPPVYKDWCSYSIRRWTHSRTEYSSGSNPTSSSDLYWPSDSTRYGERIGSRNSNYSWDINYTNNNGITKSADYRMGADLNEFLSKKKGAEGIAQVNIFGVVRKFK